MWNRSKDTHCPDCGRPFSAFGVCPKARPEDVAVMAAPVSCGERGGHPERCSCVACTVRRVTTNVIIRAV